MNNQASFCKAQPYQLLQKKKIKLGNHDVGQLGLEKNDGLVEAKRNWFDRSFFFQAKEVSPFPFGLIPDVLDQSLSYKAERLGQLSTTSPNFEGPDDLKMDSVMACVSASKEVDLGDVGYRTKNLNASYVADANMLIPAYKSIGVTYKEIKSQGPFTVIGNRCDDPPRLWSSFIESKRFHLSMRDAALCLGNAYGVKMGLPPNHEILGFEMALDRTSRPFGGSQPVQVIVGMGGRNVPFPTTVLLRNLGMGETHRKADGFPFTELAQVVREIAERDAIVQFCLMRLEGQVYIIKGDGQDADRFHFDM